MTGIPRREAVRRLLTDRGNLVVVTGLGASAYDVAAAGDSPLDFPLWGAMGGAAMVGLGLAIAQPSRPVLVVTGDGEMLMGVGSFATIGVEQPANLRIVVLDNERFGETGNQRTHTASGADLAGIAKASGIADTRTITTLAEVDALRADLHRLAGPLVAVLKIGGATEMEVKEKKDRVDDALNATRAAVEEGIVPGGGVALLRVSKRLTKVSTDNDDQKTGVEIVRRALTMPLRQIAENAGDDGAVIAGKVTDSKDANFGYDAQGGTYVDMVKAGIIDPTKVVRIALQDAASIAGLLITTEAMIGSA